MFHLPPGIRRAAPTRDRASTLAEQTAVTVGLACTVVTLKDDALEGMMPIANVCQ